MIQYFLNCSDINFIINVLQITLRTKPSMQIFRKSSPYPASITFHERSNRPGNATCHMVRNASSQFVHIFFLKIQSQASSKGIQANYATPCHTVVLKQFVAHTQQCFRCFFLMCEPNVLQS